MLVSTYPDIRSPDSASYSDKSRYLQSCPSESWRVGGKPGILRWSRGRFLLFRVCTVPSGTRRRQRAPYSPLNSRLSSNGTNSCASAASRLSIWFKSSVGVFLFLSFVSA